MKSSSRRRRRRLRRRRRRRRRHAGDGRSRDKRRGRRRRDGSEAIGRSDRSANGPRPSRPTRRRDHAPATDDGRRRPTGSRWRRPPRSSPPPTSTSRRRRSAAGLAAGGCRASSWVAGGSSGAARSGRSSRRRAACAPSDLQPSCSRTSGAERRLAMDPRALLARILDRPPRRVRPADPRHLRPRRRWPAGQRPRVRRALRDDPDGRLVLLGLAGCSSTNRTIQQELATRCPGVPAARRTSSTDPRRDCRRRGPRRPSSGSSACMWTVGQFACPRRRVRARSSRTSRERDIVRRTSVGFAWVGHPRGRGRRAHRPASSLAALDALAPAVPRPGRRPVCLTCRRPCSAWPRPWSMSSSIGAAAGAPDWRVVRCPAAIVGRDLVILSQVFAVPRAAAGRGRRPGGFARGGVRRARLAVVHLPGAALRRGLGPGSRGRGPRADAGRVEPGQAPGGSRSAGRTGPWRRVTDRS